MSCFVKKGVRYKFDLYVTSIGHTLGYKIMILIYPKKVFVKFNMDPNLKK